jgi:hypothetical protein
VHQLPGQYGEGRAERTRSDPVDGGTPRSIRQPARSGHARGIGTHQAALTAQQIVDLSHFLRERIEAVARNRTPTAPINVLTGDPEAGRAYFNGAGRCGTVTRRPANWRDSPFALRTRWRCSSGSCFRISREARSGSRSRSRRAREHP